VRCWLQCNELSHTLSKVARQEQLSLGTVLLVANACFRHTGRHEQHRPCSCKQLAEAGRPCLGRFSASCDCARSGDLSVVFAEVRIAFEMGGCNATGATTYPYSHSSLVFLRAAHMPLLFDEHRMNGRSSM
jgi:hypothetical protein